MKDNVIGFLNSAKGAGALLLTAMVMAFVWVNSPFAASYELIHHAQVTVSIGDFELGKPMISWINEGLMVIFFFLVGLEIKREVLAGQLSSLSQIALPAFGALGGMLVPALVYLYFNQGDQEAMRGWAIPVATDIVLVLALLAILENRIPLSLKIFLTALAVFDDLGTLVAIAGFYSHGLSALSLALAGGGLGALGVLNRFGVFRISLHLTIGLFIWLAILESGVHATIAGVLIAFMIPISVDDEPILERIEHALAPWVAMLIIPVFAFFNSGISISDQTADKILSPVSVGVILGLFVGKQLGVMLGVLIAVGFRLSRLPAGCDWYHMYGAAVLTGVGFTMGLFVVGLAFSQAGLILSTNFSVIIGSCLSAAMGLAILSARSIALDATDQRNSKNM
ncbi:MAG: Na+/H+ antiporter NhaA [Hyphomonas sp.]|nr:Na+/H+ antiporter NhaA [Hyphomonas sp.]